MQRKTTRATALDLQAKPPVPKPVQAKRSKDMDEVAAANTSTEPVVGISKTIQKVLRAKQDSFVHPVDSLPHDSKGA